MQSFLRHDGARWASEFAGLDPTRRGAFGDRWRDIAAREPEAFFAAQHAYIERTHYNPVVSYVVTATGVDIGSRSRAVQNAVWSMSVQHGRAARLVASAVQQVGPPPAGADAAYDARLINALYDVREAYVDSIGLSGQRTRYTRERRDALRQLGTQP